MEKSTLKQIVDLLPQYEINVHKERFHFFTDNGNFISFDASNLEITICPLSVQIQGNSFILTLWRNVYSYHISIC